MNRILFLLPLLSLTALGPASGQTADATIQSVDATPSEVTVQTADATPSEAQIQAWETRLATVTDPAARLFFQATIDRAKGDPEKALQTLGRLIARHPYEKRWIARSELLSAKLYMDVGMLDSAAVSAQFVQALYDGTDEAQKAAELSVIIEQLKKETEGSVE